MSGANGIRIDLADGKYTYLRNKDGIQSALRYGEPWCDLDGDNFVAALADALIDEREKNAALAGHQCLFLGGSGLTGNEGGGQVCLKDRMLNKENEKMTDPTGFIYPSAYSVEDEFYQFHDARYGLTKREYFAAMAMKAILSRNDPRHYAQPAIQIAVRYADELITALNKEAKE